MSSTIRSLVADLGSWPHRLRKLHEVRFREASRQVARHPPPLEKVAFLTVRLTRPVALALVLLAPGHFQHDQITAAGA
jgi:hypothetical protein